MQATRKASADRTGMQISRGALASRHSLEGQGALHGWLKEAEEEALARPGRHQVCRMALQGRKWAEGALSAPELKEMAVASISWMWVCSTGRHAVLAVSHPCLAEENVGPRTQHLLWVASLGSTPHPWIPSSIDPTPEGRN